MSKIGKMPITIPNGITVAMQGANVQVTGPKGNLTYTTLSGVNVTVDEGKVLVTVQNPNDRADRAKWGLSRAIISNLIKGVDTGFEKRLEIVGVGYRAQMQGNTLVLSLGFAHPVKIDPLEGIKLAVVDNGIVVSGIDKALVGQTAAQIRAVKPPEPYKGKGIKYKGERIRRKAGKAAKAGAK